MTGNGDDGEIDIAGHLADISVGLVAEDFTAGAGYQIDSALVPAFQQAFGGPVSVLRGIGRSADQGDAFWLEQRCKIRHATSPFSPSSSAWLLA